MENGFSIQNYPGRPIEKDLPIIMTKHCVLLADDDKDEVYLLRWAFRQAGLHHQIVDVPDGAVAIEYLKGAPPFDDRAKYPLPRLLLLDLKMPRVNGFNVLAWLGTRPEFSSLPAVVLSASVFQADYQKVVELGAREFLTKPFDMEEMVVLVQGLHLRWLAGDPITMAAATIANMAEAQIRPDAQSPR